MNIMEMLTPAERAKQLREPEGAIGVAVANWTSEHNKVGNEKAVIELGIEPESRVLEIGFGDGRTAPKVVSQADGVRYTGIDISSTMVDEASLFNAGLIASGEVSFVHGAAQNMPFKDNAFDHVFSIGVIHFWTDPEVALAEVRRVLRSGGMMLMDCLAPEAAPPFARPEFGFHLREADAWEKLCEAAGFSDLKIENIIFQRKKPDGTPIPFHTIRIEARS